MACRITVCEGCRKAEGPLLGAALADRLRGLVPKGVEVRTVDCMIVCGDPVSVSIREEGKAAYLFAGVDPEAQVTELATFAELYLAAEGGIVEDVRPCGDLRFRLVGRIPA